MDDAATERARCVAICDKALQEHPESRILLRVRNMIYNGLPPMTFAEQIQRDLDEMERKPHPPSK